MVQCVDMDSAGPTAEAMISQQTILAYTRRGQCKQKYSRI